MKEGTARVTASEKGDFQKKKKEKKKKKKKKYTKFSNVRLDAHTVQQEKTSLKLAELCWYQGEDVPVRRQKEKRRQGGAVPERVTAKQGWGQTRKKVSTIIL